MKKEEICIDTIGGGTMSCYVSRGEKHSILCEFTKRKVFVIKSDGVDYYINSLNVVRIY